MSTTQRTATLADPVTLRCGLVLRNRIAKAAMSEQLGDLTGAPAADLERLYERWARGGLGLSITGNVMVDRRSIGEPRNVVVEDDRGQAALSRWAAAARAHGTAALVQVNHPGAADPAGFSTRVVAPSAIGLSYKGAFPKPRALEGDVVVELVARFARDRAAGGGGGLRRRPAARRPRVPDLPVPLPAGQRARRRVGR